MYKYLLEARRKSGSVYGEVRQSSSSSSSGVVGLGEVDVLTGVGGVILKVRGVEEGESESVYSHGVLKKYRLVGSWEGVEYTTGREGVLFSRERMDMKNDFLESEDEYNLYVSGESAKIGVGVKVKSGLSIEDRGSFRLEGVDVKDIEYLTESEADEALYMGNLEAGKVYIRGGGLEMRQKGLTEPVGGWKVLSLSSGQECLRKGWVRSLDFEGFGEEVYISHVPRDIGEYLVVQVEDKELRERGVTREEQVRVYKTDAELNLDIAEGVGLSLESGKVKVNLEMCKISVGVGVGWKGYGEKDYVSEWSDYAEYSSDRERWEKEYEIRRRGHTIDYRRKSNGTGYGWNTTRRKNWDAFTYREMPLTVGVELIGVVVRSESLTSFKAIGVEGREPTEGEKLEYGLELSLDGLRWESEGLKIWGGLFSYGGLSGGVNVVGRSKLRKEFKSQVVGGASKYDGSVGLSLEDERESILGFGTSSPYVYNVLSKKYYKSGSGFYIGSKKLVYGDDYVIEEGVEIPGLVTGEVYSKKERGVNRLVLLKSKYNYKNIVRKRVERLEIPTSGVLVRSVGGVQIDGVSMGLEGEGWDFIYGSNEVRLKEMRGTKVLGVREKIVGPAGVEIEAGMEIVYSPIYSEGGVGSVWVEGVIISGEQGLLYEKRKLEGNMGELSLKNVVVGEVSKDLLGRVLKGVVCECRVFGSKEYGSLLDVKSELERIGGKSFWVKSETEGWLPIDVVGEPEDYEEGELSSKWLIEGGSVNEYKWRVVGGEEWVEWDENILIDGVAVSRVKKALEGEYNIVTNDLNVGIASVTFPAEVRIEKAIKSYEGGSGAIALEGILEQGEEVYVLYNLSELVVASNGLNEEHVTEGVEEKVSFVNTEDIECVEAGKLSLSLASSTSVASVVNLSDGSTYVGTTGVGLTTVSGVFLEVGVSYRVSYVVGASPKGGEQVVRVTGSINETYIEVAEGSNVLVVGGYGSNLDRGTALNLSIVAGLIDAGVKEGSLVEIGTHIFSVKAILGVGGILEFEQVARYPVRVYVSGLDKGSNKAIFRVIESSSGFEGSGFVLGVFGPEGVVGYKKEGTELILSKGSYSGLKIGEGHIIRLGVGEGSEFYRIVGEPREGATTYVVSIEGKLSKIEEGKVGLAVASSIRVVANEGDSVFQGKAVYVRDGYDLLYKNGAGVRYDVLENGVDYLLDITTGAIRLLKKKVQAQDIFMLLYSVPLELSPVVRTDGGRDYPKYELIDIVSERLPTKKEVDSGLYYEGRVEIGGEYYIGTIDEGSVEGKIAGGKSLVSYPSGSWQQEGEGVEDYMVKDTVARNTLSKYQELLVNLEAQLGCFKGDGGIIKEMSYWVEDGAYWGGWDKSTGGYNEENFWGNMVGLITNQIDDKVRQGYSWIPLSESKWSPFFPNRMEYVVKLETEVEFEGGKTKKKRNRGTIENLGYGDLPAVSDIELQRRYGRFKVAGIGNAGEVYLSAVSLDEFPDVEEFGFLPENSFISQSLDPDVLSLYTTTGEIGIAGLIPDVVSGRYDYFYKGLNVGGSIAVVKNKRGAGTAYLVYDLGYPIVVGPSYNASTGLTETKLGYARSVVESIEGGYKVKFSGTPVVLDENGDVFRLEDYVEVGDTIVEVAGGAFSDLSGEYNNIDPAELLSSGDSYTIGRDINFSRKTGEFSEKKLSSFWDPGFPWLEILGQNKPQDGMFYGGIVEFNNKDVEPYITPGLDGEYQRVENGDEGVPLLYRTGEAKVLHESAGQISKILREEVGGIRVYPDEIRTTDATAVTKPFELLYNTSSNVPYYLGYVDALNAGYYTVFECTSEQVVFRIDSVQYMPVNTLTTRLYRAFIGVNQTYSFYSLTNFIGLDANFLDNEGLILTLQDEATSTKRVILYCGAVKSVQGSLEGGPSIAVVSAEYSQAEGRLSITTAVADGDWFDMTDFNPSITPDPFAFIQVGSNVNWACSVDFLSKLGEIESNLKVFKCDSLLNSTLLGGLYSGAKLVIGEDEVYGTQGTKVVLTDVTGGVFINSSFGEYPVTDILGSGVVLIDVETPNAVDIPKWSILVGSEVDSDGFIFKETDPNKCAYIQEYGLLTDGDALSPNNYSKVRAGDILVMYEGYEMGAHKVKAIQNTEYVGRKVLSINYPRVETASQELITVLGVTSSELEEMYPLEGGTLYFNVNPTTQYKATWSGLNGNSFTLAISGITDLAGNPITDLTPLVGSYLSGMTTLPVLEPLGDIPFEDIDGKLYEGEEEYAVSLTTGLYNNRHYTSEVPLPLNVYIGVTVQVKIRRGVYLDKDFRILNKYTGNITKSLKDSLTVFGVAPFNSKDPLTLTNVEVRRIRRFSNLYQRLSTNLKELYTFYAKHSGMTAFGVSFIANYYMLLSQASLSETESEYLSYMTEKSPNLFSVVLDRERPKLKVGDELKLINLRCKVVRVLSDDKTVWFIVKDVVGMVGFTEEMPLSKILFAERLNYLTPPVIPPIYNDAIPYEIQYRNSIGEYPLEQTFESLMRNAFTDVYKGSNGNGELVVDEVKHTGVTIEELVATNKLYSGDRYAVTNQEGLDDLTSNCYLVIDASGVLGTGERSLPPEGDYWDAGLLQLVENYPSALDDNRGAYKIVGLEDGKMSVEPIVAIDGFLPSVHGVSGVDAHKLLVSLPPDEMTNLYVNNPENHSIDNYGYKIVRIKSHVSQEMAELILFMRERTLSWMEKLRALEGMEASNWDVFESTGYNQVGEDDMVSLSDVRLLGYEGNVEELAYEPTIDSLSILERRMWIEDSKLEGYAGYPSPGAVTAIEGQIENDGIRDIRNDWIEKRVHKVDGTIVQVRRYNW